MSKHSGSLVGLRRPWCPSGYVSANSLRKNSDGFEVATCPYCKREVRIRWDAYWSMVHHLRGFYRHYRFIPENWR